jgi:hypothetical protein
MLQGKGKPGQSPQHRIPSTESAIAITTLTFQLLHRARLEIGSFMSRQESLSYIPAAKPKRQTPTNPTSNAK